MSREYLAYQSTATRPVARGGVRLDQPPTVTVATQAPVFTSRPLESRLEDRFRELVRQWKEGTEFTSSTTQIVMHPAYQQIIGMGKVVLPLLIAELRRKPDHWFWALKAITGEDPVPPANRGKVRRMAQAWLEWAERQGY